jgi:helix-turn-helix, Psq domain
LQEAINSIVTQKMRFTQASSHYNIPKGTLYDNILGKSKRMLVLDEVGLDASEEDAVLDFCCETSVMPYNRRTNKSLESILSFVEKLKHSKGQSNFRLSLGTILAFRWWWAFCKKHNIVSLFYSKNKSGKNSSKNNNSNHHNNNNNESSSLLLPTKSANNNLSPPPGDDLPENLSSSKFDDDDSSGGGSGGVGGGGHADEGVADADGPQMANLTAPFYRSLNNNNIHLSQALQLGHAFLIRQGHHHNFRSRTHSVDQDEDSDLEPENLSVHKD